MRTKLFLSILPTGVFIVAILLAFGLMMKGEDVANASPSGSIISGHVKDNQGNGLYGVRIQVSYISSLTNLYLPVVVKSGETAVGYSPRTLVKTISHLLADAGPTVAHTPVSVDIAVVTDISGYFALTDLPPGSYILTPLGDYFLPFEREISIPPDFSEQDFVLDIEIPYDMHYVAEGEFWMGCDPDHTADSVCYAGEQPLHPVYLDAFLIDKYEVTNVEYAECVLQGFCNPPLTNTSVTRTYYFGNATYANYPVMYISWDDAVDYCAWDCKRLPTEAEWEKAARGVTPRAYPWGDEPGSCTLANGNKCMEDTTQVGAYPLGASPYGLMDMAGNLSEWVYDWYSLNYYDTSPYDNPTGPETGVYKVYRGGNYYLGWRGLCTSRRPYCNPGVETNVIGFRCMVAP